MHQTKCLWPISLTNETSPVYKHTSKSCIVPVPCFRKYFGNRDISRKREMLGRWWRQIQGTFCSENFMNVFLLKKKVKHIFGCKILLTITKQFRIFEIPRGFKTLLYFWIITIILLTSDETEFQDEITSCVKLFYNLNIFP